MTTRRTIEVDTFILLAASAVAGVVFATYFNHKSNIRIFSLFPGLQTTDIPTTSPLPPAPKVNTFSQTSPDGVQKLTMTVTPHTNFTKTYLVTNSGLLVYSLSLPEGESIRIPFNTWSPDNKYFFLEKTTASESAALVMKASGEPVIAGEAYFDAAAIFRAKNTGNTYKETTGWASETLLIVNTTKPDGSKGPSYWVEVPSKAVLQLATEF